MASAQYYMIVISIGRTGIFGYGSVVLRNLTDTAEIKELKWKTPSVESVKSKAMDWLKEKNVDAAIRAKADKIWDQASDRAKEEDLLERLAATFALVDANSEKLVALCSQSRASLVLPEQTWLGDPQTPRFVAHNMRLFYARWLVQESLFEEAREQISELEPSDVVAPATLLFYQSVVYHKLLEKESGLKTLEELLSAEDTSPKRYVAVARLMQDDLKGLEDGFARSYCTAHGRCTTPAGSWTHRSKGPQSGRRRDRIAR